MHAGTLKFRPIHELLKPYQQDIWILNMRSNTMTKLIEYGVYVACFLGSIYVFASAVAEVVRP